MISLIVICDSEYGIGKDEAMPWSFPADLAYFQKVTMGHPVVMGRKTFDSVGVLSGRKNIVLSNNPDFEHVGVLVESDLFMALEHAKWLEGGEEVFVIGGAKVYEQALAAGLVNKIYLTMIPRQSYSCDVFFQDLFLAQFNESHRTVRNADEKNPERLEFVVYDKRGPNDPADKIKTQ